MPGYGPDFTNGEFFRIKAKGHAIRQLEIGLGDGHRICVEEFWPCVPDVGIGSLLFVLLRGVFDTSIGTPRLEGKGLEQWVTDVLLGKLGIGIGKRLLKCVKVGIARMLVELRNNDRLSHYKTPEALNAV